ncbi:MAG: hypothetical protein KGN36_07610 [Acidobacteriota bacterium]|nr:hypothetical protein [Acidobacteriota bacterium]
MKKSAKVTLTVVAAAALASCGRSAQDPCDRAYYDDLACQEAIRSGGYYWRGTWMPMVYSYPYPYYYDRYRSYAGSGGRVYSSTPGTYARPSSSSPSGVTRGGFGSTGAAHSSGS